MPTPPKTYDVLISEKKSHRTKAELELRKKGEEALSTGTPMKVRSEVRVNKFALKEYKRVDALLKAMGRNDALYEPIINRYAQLQAECIEFEEKRESFYENILQLKEDYESHIDGDLTQSRYFELLVKLEGMIINLDKQIMGKRKMLFDIERENAMTIASALRIIPRKEEKPEDDQLLRALRGG